MYEESKRKRPERGREIRKRERNRNERLWMDCSVGSGEGMEARRSFRGRGECKNGCINVTGAGEAAKVRELEIVVGSCGAR